MTQAEMPINHLKTVWVCSFDSYRTVSVYFCRLLDLWWCKTSC